MSNDLTTASNSRDAAKAGGSHGRDPMTVTVTFGVSGPTFCARAQVLFGSISCIASAAVAEVKRKAASKSLAQRRELLTRQPRIASVFAHNIVPSQWAAAPMDLDRTCCWNARGHAFSNPQTRFEQR